MPAETGHVPVKARRDLPRLRIESHQGLPGRVPAPGRTGRAALTNLGLPPRHGPAPTGSRSEWQEPGGDAGDPRRTFSGRAPELGAPYHPPARGPEDPRANVSRLAGFRSAKRGDADALIRRRRPRAEDQGYPCRGVGSMSPQDATVPTRGGEGRGPVGDAVCGLSMCPRTPTGPAPAFSPVASKRDRQEEAGVRQKWWDLGTTQLR